MLHARQLHTTTAGAASAFAQLRALGRTIRQLLTEQHIDPDQLAATLDISPTCLVDLEEGRYDPTFDLLLDLADALDLPPYDSGVDAV